MRRIARRFRIRRDLALTDAQSDALHGAYVLASTQARNDAADGYTRSARWTAARARELIVAFAEPVPGRVPVGTPSPRNDRAVRGVMDRDGAGRSDPTAAEQPAGELQSTPILAGA